jgi:secondary thiamine-phosphate synthase enzyme
MVKIQTKKIVLNTKGTGDLLNVTGTLKGILSESRLKNGNLTVFVIGSTAAVMAFEYEPGLIKDIREFFEKIIPSAKSYHHDDTWNDANGYSHIRSALQGSSFTVPFENGKLLLGTWQQVVVAEFDNRPRQREIVAQLIGEP